MTETEWLGCTDPRPMMRLLYGGKVTDRQMRLFAVACCRRILHLLPDERSRQAIEVAERYADGQATKKELQIASDSASAVWNADMDQARTGRDEADDYFPSLGSQAAYNATVPMGWWGRAPAFVAPYEVAVEVATDPAAERAAQCVLLRDIFGNPFRPVVAAAAWRTSATVAIARTIYLDRCFEDLPILADALEEAGCTSPDLLHHCRQPGEHVRGCWVLDLLLAKE